MDEPKQPDDEAHPGEGRDAEHTYDLEEAPAAPGGADAQQTEAPLDDTEEEHATPDADEPGEDLYAIEAPPPPPVEPPAPEPKREDDEEPTGDLHIGDALSSASELLMANFALIAGGSFVVTTSLLGPGIFTLTAPLLVGHMRAILKRLNGEAVEFGEVFSGFHEYRRTLVAGLIILGIVICASCVLAVGSWLLMHVLWPWLAATLSIAAHVVVGVGIAALLYFALPMVAFSQAKPTDALRASAAFGLLHPAAMALLAACTAVVALAGILVAGLGWLVTFPLATVLQIVAYREFYLPTAAVAEAPQAPGDAASDLALSDEA